MVVQARVKNAYFDIKAVTKAVGAAKAKILWKQSLDLRDDAIRSIPNTMRRSLPGNPPSSHVGAKRAKIQRQRRKQGLVKLPVLRGFGRGIKYILTDYDTRTESFVIGAPRFPGTKQPNNPVPGLLEHGGIGPRPVRGGFKNYYSAPRPFMQPALTRAIPKLLGPWRDAVRSA